MSDVVRVVRFGESALLVELGTAVDEATNARVMAMRAAIEADHGAWPGVGPTVPGYATLLVPFEPWVDPTDLERRLRSLAASGAAAGPPEALEPMLIPVRYGGEDGPDLAVVADATGQHPDDVIAAHSGTTYRVFLLGFSPGFAYLGTLPASLHLPRRVEPRVRVPAGSVAIAEAQTAVYPFSTPGGWHLLGRTDVAFWDPAASTPALLAPGDRVRFVAR